MTTKSLRLTYIPHAKWPLPPVAHSKPTADTSPLRVCVLDSSFNPPSSAHLALVDHSPWPTGKHSPGSSSSIGSSTGSTLSRQQCDARLLILSTKNADKGQAEHHDIDVRLQMMQAVAQHLNSVSNDDQAHATLSENVAVACTEAPTFVAKSDILKRELVKLADGRDVTMLFPLGWDTIVRFFAPRYYPDPDRPIQRVMHDFFVRDGSLLACARRPTASNTETNQQTEEEETFLNSEHVKPWRDKIVMFDLPQEMSLDVSSTKIRQLVKQDDAEAHKQLAKLVPVDKVRQIIQRENLYTT
ncbi:hypothetical protein OIO90_005048 [Microbotryomycetes sp. JL221]|nr:hypothetical protein OIO90_005048 [Microbotryomycetes sp. JL221]